MAQHFLQGLGWHGGELSAEQRARFRGVAGVLLGDGAGSGAEGACSGFGDGGVDLGGDVEA